MADDRTYPKTANSLLEHTRRQREEVAALLELWTDIFPDNFAPPNKGQFRTWLDLYDFAIVVKGLTTAANRFGRRAVEAQEDDDTEPMTKAEVIKYASGVMKITKMRSAE